LEVTTKDLNADTKALADLHRLCMNKASDFEAEQKSREDELKAIAQAKKVILESTSGAASQQYGLNQVSFFQRSQISSRVDLANFEAVRFVRDLARRTNAPALTQLASRMAYAMHFGGDPFAKIKGLISDMISKLEEAAEADATEKAYCDKEIAETNEKKADKTSEIEKLSTKIDQNSARSEKLKYQVTTLQKELAELAASQSEMDKLRGEENKAYVSNRADMEKGLNGVKKALTILREYYAQDHSHAAAEGAGAGILGLLEVVESDFSKSLAEMIATEETAQNDYDAQSKENEIDQTTKQQDVKYKSKEFTGLDKAVSELSADRSGVENELDAVMEYLRSLDARCQGTIGKSEFGLAKAESYSDRKGRRESEIAGLKEALTILEGEASTVLLQRRALRKQRSS
jgi:predicted RNase H-like nuclease (RuvC/YqgF family)